MRPFQDNAGTIWSRTRGLLLAIVALALATQWLAGDPPRDMAVTLVAAMMPVLVAALIATWAGREPSRAKPRLVRGLSAFAAASLLAAVGYGILAGAGAHGYCASLALALVVVYPVTYCAFVALSDPAWPDQRNPPMASASSSSSTGAGASRDR